MNYFDLYKTRVQQNGNNFAEVQRNKVLQNISKVFKKSPSYYEKEVVDLAGNITIKGMQIFDNNSLSKQSPTNQKNIIMQPNNKLEIGYLIKDYNSSNWICIKKDNLLTEKGIIQECNESIKWISTNDKVTIHEICAIQNNLSLYSIGTDENKYFISEDGKRMITVPMNVITKELYVGQRFILGSDVFKISEIYDGTIGIYEIKMAQCDKMVGRDDFDLGIAYNEGVTIILPPTTPNYSIQILGDSDIQVSYSKTYQAKVYNSGVETIDNVIWSIDNPTNATIIPSGNSCVINGLMQDTYIVLTAKLQKDNSILCNKEIYIKGSW